MILNLKQNVRLVLESRAEPAPLPKLWPKVCILSRHTHMLQRCMYICVFEATELFKALQSNPALLELLRSHTQPNPAASQAVSNLIHQGTNDSLESKDTSNSDAFLEARFQRLSVQGMSEAASTQSEPGTAPGQTPKGNMACAWAWLSK